MGQSWLYQLTTKLIISRVLGSTNKSWAIDKSFTHSKSDWEPGNPDGHVYVKTPKGHSIYADTYSNELDMPEEDKEQKSQEVRDTYPYPYAQEVGYHSSTIKYNCHGYAWSITEGGATCNISTFCAHAYMETQNVGDTSYTPTTNLTETSKVYYYETGHSGIKDGDYIISKWGNVGPLVRHTMYYGPAEYIDGEPTKYKLSTPIIKGNLSPLCDGNERLFYSNIKIDGSTYTWSKPTSLLGVVNSITVEPVDGGARGWLQLTITTPSNHQVSSGTYYFQVDVPYTPSEIYPDSPGDYCPDSYIWFYMDDPYNHDVTYYWDVIGDANLYYGQGGSMVQVNTGQSGSFYLTLKAGNSCGYSDEAYSNTYYISYYCKSGMFILYPNPAEDKIQIELTEEPEEPVSLDIYNSNNVKIFSSTMSSKDKTIDISRLPKGV
jgi:hypothetical protein